MALFPYALSIRAKTAAGAVLASFYAGSLYRGVLGAPSAGTSTVGGIFIAPTILGPPRYVRDELPREGYDGYRDPITRGFRPTLHVEWQIRSTEVLGLTGVGLSNLRSAITYITTVGDYIELALDGWLSSPNYRKVNLVSDIDYQPIAGGKLVGLALALDFEGKALISSQPAADATSWGTAT